MFIDGKNYQSIWIDGEDNTIVRVIDQQKLPFFFEVKELRSVDDVFGAIKDMTVRGAPLIGAAGAFGIYLSTLEITHNTNIRSHLSNAASYLISCRPTAVNLSWAVNHVLKGLEGIDDTEVLQQKALQIALAISAKEKENCKKIGEHGYNIISEISQKKNGGRVNILTHCNAGWLACIDYGTATAPVYLAHEKGIDLHVWVDETRPKNQGARLTCWELGQQGVPYTLIADNAGGYLMQKGMVDIVMVGSDRTTARGDVANKTGTYLKALAAHDNHVPFYALMPSTSIDLSLRDGLKEITVEEREPGEVTTVTGYADGNITTVRICPEDADAGNWGFDITPARLVTGIITEKGVCAAKEKEIKKMFSDNFN